MRDSTTVFVIVTVPYLNSKRLSDQKNKSNNVFATHFVRRLCSHYQHDRAIPIDCEHDKTLYFVALISNAASATSYVSDENKKGRNG